ncbi:MAG: hypothetical protein AABX52_04140 [Nanoarchaeota archaeon]
MKIDIKQKQEFPLLGRLEISGTLSFDAATPNLKEVQQTIADKLSTKPELIVINHVYSDFGSRNALINAYIYQDTSSRDTFSIIPKKSLVAAAKLKFDTVRKQTAEKKAETTPDLKPAEA